jgi:preprotein translocase subunit SecG
LIYCIFIPPRRFKKLEKRMQWIKIAQIIIAILLMAAILMQNRGGGLSGIFGGGDGVYRTKRGIEKSLFYTTIVLAVLFFAIAILGLILSNKA